MYSLILSVSYTRQFVFSPHFTPHTRQALSIAAPKMIGEGRKAKREMKETVMMRLAALSRSSTARREMSWLATRPVEEMKEFRSITIRTTINCLEQSVGQYP